jgi:DNA-binding transcriptional regulator LsrR (DeoR family)
MNTDKQKFLIEVSKLYYYDNLQQEEIARLYYSSRSTISRALDAARREGLVRIIIPEVGFDPRELEAQLRKTFNLSHVHVVPVNQSDDLIDSSFLCTVYLTVHKAR